MKNVISQIDSIPVKAWNVISWDKFEYARYVPAKISRGMFLINTFMPLVQQLRS
jgi:hypothetical protein